MRFASLGSGSAGNALVVQSGKTTVLLDCGFGVREMQLRLGRLGLEAERISAILVTHEHDDHIGSALQLSARHNIPLYLSHGTLQSTGKRDVLSTAHLIDSHTDFAIGDIQIQPYPVPHDAREPVQFSFSNGEHRLGVLTDTGMSTPHIERTLSGCHALVLECNHDLEMLEKGSYPHSLKQRIKSRYGHLDNTTASELLSRLDNRQLQHIVAAHLSAQNNTPELAKTALSHALGCHQDWIGVAEQEHGFDWRCIT